MTDIDCLHYLCPNNATIS